MRASLADEPGAVSLAIALGANLPSPAGDPIDTLVAVRPQLEGLVTAWWAALERASADASSAPAGKPPHPHWSWSPLFATAPVGGPADQPIYSNAVLVVEGGPGSVAPCAEAALQLLQALHQLEQRYGRQRRERWGPRSLDLDLLWWGELVSPSPSLELPHPRWHERGFVLAPLLAIERRRGQRVPCPHPAGLESAAVAIAMAEPLPQPLPPRSGWPE